MIPSYGFSHHLERCLESALRQDFDSFEVILVDDNEFGTDEHIKTKALVDSAKRTWRNLVYVAHEQNLNGAAARNSGVKAARGEYIAFLDNDDVFTIDRIRKCYDFIKASKGNLVGVFTWVELRRDNAFLGLMKTNVGDDPLKFLLACKFPVGTGSNLFIHNEIYDLVGGFDISFLRHQDYEFLVRCFKIGSRFGVIDEALVIKNDEKYNFPNCEIMHEQKAKFLEKHKDILAGMNEPDRRFVWASNYFSLLEQSIRNRDYSKTLYFFRMTNSYGLIGIWKMLRLVLLLFRSFLIKLK